jgi:hypothetical protein
VRFDVVLGGVAFVIGGMHGVAVSQMGVVSGLLVVFGFMMGGGFMVVARSVLVVFRCLLVVLSCFLGHRHPPDCLKRGPSEPMRIIGRRTQGVG